MGFRARNRARDENKRKNPNESRAEFAERVPLKKTRSKKKVDG